MRTTCLLTVGVCPGGVCVSRGVCVQGGVCLGSVSRGCVCLGCVQRVVCVFGDNNMNITPPQPRHRPPSHNLEADPTPLDPEAPPWNQRQTSGPP